MGAFCKANKYVLSISVSFVLGLLFGLLAGGLASSGQRGTLTATGIDSLPIRAISSLNAEIQGTVTSTTGTTITLESNGERVKLDIPSDLSSFYLSETSPYTTEDQAIWDAYQIDLQNYTDAVQNFDPGTEPGEAVSMPIYPTAPFQIVEAMPLVPEDTEPAQAQKIERKTVTPADLEKGDTVRVTLGLTSSLVSGDPGSSEVSVPSVRIIGMYAVR